MIRRTIALATLGALAACASVPTAHTGSEIVFYDYAEADEPTAIDIRFDDGSGERIVGDDLRLRDMGSPLTPLYRTRSTGEVTATVTLRRNGRIAATETVTLPLRPDWRWGVGIRADGRNPQEPCLGCMGVEWTPIDPALAREPNEHLYLVWSGNSISAPTPY